MKREANPLDHDRTRPIPANKPRRSHIGSPPHVGGPSIDVTEVTGHPPRLVTTLDGPCIRHSVRMTLVRGYVGRAISGSIGSAVTSTAVVGNSERRCSGLRW